MPSLLRDYEVNNVSVRQALKDSPQLASDAIKKELQQMLEKKVFHPVKHSPIKPIPSKMFLKKKLDSKGALLKWKARFSFGSNPTPSHRLHQDGWRESHAGIQVSKMKQDELLVAGGHLQSPDDPLFPNGAP
jgi:hypothetical protein